MEQEKAMDGLEEVSKVLARYSAVEKLLLSKDSKKRNLEFEASIVTTYTEVLRYQVCATCHFSHGTVGRMFESIMTSNDWTRMLKKIQDADRHCQGFITLMSTQKLLESIQTIRQGFDRKLYEKWQNAKTSNDKILLQWTDDRIQASEALQDENEKILNWISDVRVGQDHAAIREKLGASYWDSGQWFFNPYEDEHDNFQDWKLSVRDQLWLQGTVGTGKTSLTSLVINHLIEHLPKEQLAFYYCSRSTRTNTPVAILRSLVSQLAWSSDALNVEEHVKRIYRKQNARRSMECTLSISECVDLLITLVKLHGWTIIVIDGLDECEGPMQLLWDLSKVWNSSEHLKLFVTSREGIEVSKVFPLAHIVRSGSEKTSGDIRTYIIRELYRKERRNATVVTDDLANRMVAVLTQLAGGM